MEGGIKLKHKIGDLPSCPTDIFFSLNVNFTMYIYFLKKSLKTKYKVSVA